MLSRARVEPCAMPTSARFWQIWDTRISTRASYSVAGAHRPFKPKSGLNGPPDDLRLLRGGGFVGLLRLRYGPGWVAYFEAGEAAHGDVFA